MRKLLVVSLCLSLVIPLFPCHAADTVISVRKLIRGDNNDVHVMGRWRVTGASARYSKLSKINTVSITCSRQLGVCREAIAELVSPEENELSRGKELRVIDFVYNIVEWSDQTIHAKHPAPVADIELRVSVKDKFAERRFRETKARGVDTSDPNIFVNWVLE